VELISVELFLVELSFGRVVFWSSCLLVELVLANLTWSNCRLIELSFGRVVVWSSCLLVELVLANLTWSSCRLVEFLFGRVVRH
jgi:hypothetical protein